MAVGRTDQGNGETRAEKKQRRREEKARQQKEREEQEAWQAFWASPRGQARRAREAGRRFFQFATPLEETVRTWTDTQQTTQQEATGLIESIELEGWELFDIGYVFQPTGSISAERLVHKGVKEEISGRIVGIYLFRASDQLDSSSKGSSTQS